jgi:hypothetical protein
MMKGIKVIYTSEQFKELGLGWYKERENCSIERLWKCK